MSFSVSSKSTELVKVFHFVSLNSLTLHCSPLATFTRVLNGFFLPCSERGRLTCPICAHRNWQQLENDLWRLEQWIQYAEATNRNRPSLPSNIEALEDVIQDHREFLVELDSHKSIVASLNIVGEHLADHAEDEEKARLLRERLYGLNRRWDVVCLQAAQWQEKLQHALLDVRTTGNFRFRTFRDRIRFPLQNPFFHDAIDSLMLWLETTETVIRRSEPVDLSQDEVIVQAQYRKFKVNVRRPVGGERSRTGTDRAVFLQDLYGEFERREPRVQALQEAAVQLIESGGPSRERLNALRLRFIGLRRLVRVYLIRLAAVLGRDPNQPAEKELVSLSQQVSSDGVRSPVESFLSCRHRTLHLAL